MADYGVVAYETAVHSKGQSFMTSNNGTPVFASECIGRTISYDYVAAPAFSERRDQSEQELRKVAWYITFLVTII